ncbi:ABC transporter substrate-binding protein [Chelatococcus asaccharovorans]|uniref:Carbohydrate ABC transporter substrate-binding protein (CUT1 family) n=1 Tax=Chelatococcus asaccharovorans TaxID=28210 RepID=A0A2V3U928_9HYPH|nr:extracellular solute-binding protein [Chelatococcus asaccharovorans]MBS7704614.1 extracellular solute-binding protein [Chelatococcus asaccharovorans]PXW54515.1 carbohydrate ABC transporter substrate-binding protein (CUT1 family) [Chelatococcus asaccharovorans]CAH1648757.1 Carbohydrate ABC transporter substrate-binding protein (CUT1 family) [Chelatococcus asaccharovorans]CAH1687400.1 Carbohydrate ABC transporter substrate-binding protein (CUT1 family) [Chelatococcus asaccharovorans]
MTISRRDLMIAGGGLAASAAGLPLLGAQAFAQSPTYEPEKGASLRVLRWSPFVKGEEDAWLANTKKFTEATGVEVRIDKESWEDIRPKAAVAANVGSGPDIIWVWFDDAQQYPDKLLDVTDFATALGAKYGGWYEGLEGYAKRDGRFIAVPLAAIGNAVCYRDSWVKDAGFSTFPDKTDAFLEMCKALKAKGHPTGFTLGHGVGDGNNFCHWVLWSHGGKMVDENGKVAVNSPETIAALKYVRELYQTFIPGTESWLDVNNNRAFLAGEVSVTANGVSLYYAAKNDPKLAEIAADIRTTNFPVGPVGKKVELHQTTSAVIFKYSKFPKAALAYLQFMYDKPQFDAWLTGASAYCCQPLKAFASNPVWTSTPIHAPYALASETLRPNGYAGPLGYASAAVMADYVVVDMVAEAATGQRTPEEAAKRAETRANRYYKV